MVNIVVPELGESVVEARVARWLKKEGDQVALGEALVELETEKIDLEVSADRAGVLTTIKHAEGADVKVGEVLAELDPSKAAAAATAPAAPAAPAPAAPPATESAAPKATPAAKNVAKEHAVSLAAVPASGPRVTKQDVREFVAAAATPTPAPAASPAPATARPAPKPVATGERVEDRVRMTKRRATIARRLVEAQRTAAMLTTFNEVDMTAVMDIRARRKDAFTKKHGVNLGLTSFFVKAVVGALKSFPAINAEIQGDEIVYKRYYDIGMAVGAEGGLVVPVLRDADRLGFADIELGIRDFAARAGNGSLTLEDLKGGTFTITNGGVFGSHDEHAHPQSAAGGHPRPPQDRRSRGGGERPGRHPADDVPGPQLRPPHRRRPRGGAVPGEGQGLHRRSGLAAHRGLTGLQ